MTQEAPHALAAEIGPLISHSRRLMWLAAAKRFQEQGESILCWQVLNQCLRLGPMPQTTLADVLAQHPAGICRLLDEMEQRKLVKRTRDTRDRRRMNVAITARGRAHYDRFLPEMVDVAEGALAGLSVRERVTLRDLLRKLAGASAGAVMLPARELPAAERSRRAQRAHPKRRVS